MNRVSRVWHMHVQNIRFVSYLMINSEEHLIQYQEYASFQSHQTLVCHSQPIDTRTLGYVTAHSNAGLHGRLASLTPASLGFIAFIG